MKNINKCKVEDCVVVKAQNGEILVLQTGDRVIVKTTDGSYSSQMHTGAIEKICSDYVKLDSEVTSLNFDYIQEIKAQKSMVEISDEYDNYMKSKGVDTDYE